jgi:hypothetical protein
MNLYEHRSLLNPHQRKRVMSLAIVPTTLPNLHLLLTKHLTKVLILFDLIRVEIYYINFSYKKKSTTLASII